MIRKFLSSPAWFLVSVTLLLLADAQSQPVIAPGFPVPLEMNRSLQSRDGPNLADLNRDGHLEILVSSGQKVFVFQSDGSLLPGWPQSTTYFSHKTPAVGDLDGDGSFEVITFDREGRTRQSRLYVWDATGQLKTGFPLVPGFGDFPIVLHDLNNDGKLEIIGCFEGHCYVFHHDGTIASGWPYQIHPFYPSSKAAVGDVDGDGQPEIVVAVADTLLPNLPTATGRLFVWKSDGRLLPGWPIVMPTGYNFFGGCDPSLVDINHDGAMEIVVGTMRVTQGQLDGFVAIYDYAGQPLPGWPQYSAGTRRLNGAVSGPALADLDHDGIPEIIFGDFSDLVVAWHSDGSLVPGWPVSLFALDSTLSFSAIYSNPAVGDIDGDGELEVFVDNDETELVQGVWLGRYFALHHNGKSVAWSPLRPRQIAGGTLAMGDLENDGTLELITTSGSSTNNETWLTVWRISGVPFSVERLPWPTFAHDRWNTSQYGFKPPDEPTVGVKDREEREQLPQTFVLAQNYPNPFYGAGSSRRSLSNRTEISYQLPAISHVDLRVFNLLGAEVRRLVEGMRAAGAHRVFWDGRDEHGARLSPGIYFYRMEASSQPHRGRKFSFIKKLTLLQ